MACGAGTKQLSTGCVSSKLGRGNLISKYSRQIAFGYKLPQEIVKASPVEIFKAQNPEPTPLASLITELKALVGANGQGFTDQARAEVPSLAQNILTQAVAGTTYTHIHV